MKTTRLVKNDTIIAELSGWDVTNEGFSAKIEKNAPCTLEYLDDGDIAKTIEVKTHKQ